MLEKGIIKSAFKWQVLNISLQAILQLIFIIISARVLPKEVHGAFAILNALVFVMTISSEGGVSSALIQRKVVNKKHVSIAFYFTLAISALLFFVIFISSGFIAEFYDQKIKSYEVRLSSLIFVIMAIGKVSESFLIKDFRYKQLFIARNISFISGNIIAVFLLAKAGFGIYSFIYGFIITQSLTTLLYYFFTKHSIAILWGKTEFRELFYFGSSFTLLRVVNYLSSQIDKLLIGRYFSVTALSVYEKGQYISKMPPKYIGNTIDSIMFSAFSKLNDDNIKVNYLSQIVKLVFISGMYFSIIFYFNAELLVKLILGNTWLDTIPFLKLLSLSVPALLLARIGDIIVRSENKMFRSLPIKLFFLGTLVVSILYLKNDPLIILTSVVVGCYWIHGLLMLYLSFKIYGQGLIRVLISLGLLVLISAVLCVKYYYLGTLNLGNWTYLMGNILLDLIIGGLALHIFRNHQFVKWFRAFIVNMAERRF